MLRLNKICFVMMLLLCIVISAYSSDPEPVLLFSVDSFNKARIGVVNPSSKHMTLSLLNQDGLIFHSYKVDRQTNYFKVYDFSKLNDGEYELKLTASNNSEKRKFRKEEGKIYIIKNRDSDKAPVFNLQTNEYIIISYIKSRDNEKLSVFFEKNGDVIFEDIDKGPVSFSKRYSISKLPKGNYDVKVVTGENSFKYSFNIN